MSDFAPPDGHWTPADFLLAATRIAATAVPGSDYAKDAMLAAALECLRSNGFGAGTEVAEHVTSQPRPVPVSPAAAAALAVEAARREARHP